MEPRPSGSRRSRVSLAVSRLPDQQRVSVAVEDAPSLHPSSSSILRLFILADLFVICCQIRSDKDRQTKVEYYLTGPGANKPPINLFVVDHDTGFVRITGIVDRERYPFFNVSSSLYFPNNYKAV